MSTPHFHPLTDEESEVLTLFIDQGQDLLALAEHLSTTIGQLLSWFSQPHIQSALEALEHLEAFHHRRADRARREHALTTLEHCIQNSTDPKERRRAATTILRTLNAPDGRPRAARADRANSATDSYSERWAAPEQHLDLSASDSELPTAEGAEGDPTLDSVAQTAGAPDSGPRAPKSPIAGPESQIETSRLPINSPVCTHEERHHPDYSSPASHPGDGSFFPSTTSRTRPFTPVSMMPSSPPDG